MGDGDEGKMVLPIFEISNPTPSPLYILCLADSE